MSKVPLQEDALVTAIHNLTDVVVALKQTIVDDYPKRAEIERKYATKYGLRRQVVSMLVAAALAICASYLFTIYTVSYCFLQNPTTRSNQSVVVSKPGCDLMPGYREAQERNAKVYSVFNDITERTFKNQARIEKLEKKVK
jgi:hypothetical protein